jgi:hypothetical protein
MKKNIFVFVMFVGVQFVFGQVENSIPNDFAFEIENDTIKKKGKAIEEVVIIKKIQKDNIQNIQLLKVLLRIQFII